MDFLLPRVPNRVKLEESVICLPLIIWYVWKALNDKVFNDIDRSSPDILERARKEATTQFLGNGSIDDSNLNRQIVISTMDPTVPFICFLDGSWKEDDPTNGIGWILQLQDGETDLLRLRGMRRDLSPLHTELHSLIWAMKSLWKKKRYCAMFATDSQDSIAMALEPDKWPCFAPELDELRVLCSHFPEFTFTHCPRDNNEKADLLARNARLKNSIFLLLALRFHIGSLILLYSFEQSN